MNQFSISQLEKFSGIKAHTIRMWEQRYNALQPNRSLGNTRYYDNQQLRRLLNIVSLASLDYKVSELGTMTDKQLFKLVEKLINEDENKADEYFVSQLIAAGMSYDEAYFDKIFSHCLLSYGMKDTYVKVIYPVLLRTGLMWTCDNMAPANEHFISNLFRQKLFTAIDSLPPPKPDADCWILFLPENEFHEVGLLFSHYLVRLSGNKVIYLGSNIPLKSLVDVGKEISYSNLFFFLVHKGLNEEIENYLGELSNLFSGKNIYVAGDQELFERVEKIKNIHFLSSVEDLEQQLLSNP
ncbi:MAG: MerR family transcriptional regulator [Ginsengibacter sp.]